MVGPHRSARHCLCQQLGAVLGSVFSHQQRPIGFHCSPRNAEFVGHFSVGVPLSDQIKNLSFSCAQTLCMIEQGRMELESSAKAHSHDLVSVILDDQICLYCHLSLLI